jgi:hypothetical protein
MFGAIRADEDCLQCHAKAKEGELLGAFTYYLNVPVNQVEAWKRKKAEEKLLAIDSSSQGKIKFYCPDILLPRQGSGIHNVGSRLNTQCFSP